MFDAVADSMNIPVKPTGAYPDVLERWWLHRAADAVHARGGEEARWTALEAALAQLCAAFTSDRSGSLAKYSSHPETIAAYGLYYFPQSFVRMRHVLTESGTPPSLSGAAATPMRVLDLGAGVGAASAAVAAHLAETHPSRPATIVAVDRAPLALEALRGLFADVGRRLWPATPVTTRCADISSVADATDGGPWDGILVSFALNELFEGRDDRAALTWVRALLGQLTPGGRLFVCEPGTPVAARRLQVLRDALAAEGRWTLCAPCPHRAPCPMLPDPSAWCHDVRSWTPPPAARRLNRRLHLPLDVLRYSLLVMENTPESRPAVAEAPSPARLVAPPFLTAGRVVYRGCAATGVLETYETLTRGRDRAARERLTSRERGDIVEWALERRLGDGRWRAEPL